jgi:hypothetical protein
MNRCLRRAAHISAEQLKLVQTDEQMEVNMKNNMVVDIGDKSVYIYGPSTLEKIFNQQVLEAFKVTESWLHVCLDRESHHHPRSCMRMTTFMKTVTV